MHTISDAKNDSNRLAIAVFIVATTLTVLATNFSVPTILFLPISAFLIGLIVTALLAFLFILSKGYELRYRKKKENIIDKYNYILYNSAMTAYAIVMATVLLSFTYKSLNDAWKTGNILAGIGIVVLFISLIGVINRSDIKELSHVGWSFAKAQLRRNKHT